MLVEHQDSVEWLQVARNGGLQQYLPGLYAVLEVQVLWRMKDSLVSHIAICNKHIIVLQG
jgi:hypothetical protein